MRIAVPARGERVSKSLAECEAVFIYEDDHGRVVGREEEPVAGGGEAVLRLLERRGPDAVLCGPLPAGEREELMLAGLLVSCGAEGEADAAVLDYLNSAVAADPRNRCNVCGHRRECAYRRE